MLLLPSLSVFRTSLSSPTATVVSHTGDVIDDVDYLESVCSKEETIERAPIALPLFDLHILPRDWVGLWVRHYRFVDHDRCSE